MKKAALLITVIFFAFAGKAQYNEFSYYVGPVISLPMGDFSNQAGLGIGGEFQVDYRFDKHFVAFTQGGFQSFSAKTINGVSKPSIAAPTFLIGTKYSLENLHFGLGFGYTSFLGERTQDGLTLSPQVGYKISKFDIVAHYNLNSVSGGTVSTGNYNFFGIKLFYKFASNF